MRTLDSFNFKDKIILLRSDLNSDVSKGKILINQRIKRSSETIKELKKKGAKIIIIAHQGRQYRENFISLKQHSKLLSRFTKIKFIPDTIGAKSEEAILNLKQGDAILLENIRFLKEELKPGKNKIIKFFIGKVDIYINDAFSNSHRNHTSMVSFPKYFKSCAGRVLEKEIQALKKIHLKNCLYILGGAKPIDNIKLLGENKTLATGFFGQLCLISKGIKFGEHEKFLKKFLKEKFKIKDKLKKKINNTITPIDYAIKNNGKRKEIRLEDFPNKYMIYDIGGQTIELFKQEIKKAKAIYIKGPSGDCREAQFCKGTFEILKAAVNSKAFTLVGGGHLNDAIDKSKIPRKKFNHISLSGGALLRYLAGEKLPGLEALKQETL